MSIQSTLKDLSWKIEKNEVEIDKLEKLIAEHEEEKAKTLRGSLESRLLPPLTTRRPRRRN